MIIEEQRKMANDIQTYNPGDFAQVMQIIEQYRSQAVQAVNHASLVGFVPMEMAQIMSAKMTQLYQRH